MYEDYPMIHYDFSAAGDGLPDEWTYTGIMKENGAGTYELVVAADYRLRGHADVLAVFPMPDDVFRKQMHLQSFSHMYTLRGYYTSRNYAETYMLLYTHDGFGTLEYRGQSYPLKKGDLFWIDCRIPAAYRTTGEFWEHTDIHINGEGIGPLYQEFEKNNDPVLHVGNNSTFEPDLRMMLKAYVTPDALRSLRTAHSLQTLLVHLILAEKKNGSADGNSKMQKLVYYMHEHYREPLTMDDLADISGFSKYHLSREFRKTTGFPPNEYLIRLRLERAKFLLSSTSLPVYRVAELSGIENEAYF
nr:AraC family transcriptional regulator [Solobacterium sp.]